MNWVNSMKFLCGFTWHPKIDFLGLSFLFFMAWILLRFELFSLIHIGEFDSKFICERYMREILGCEFLLKFLWDSLLRNFCVLWDMFLIVYHLTIFSLLYFTLFIRISCWLVTNKFRLGLGDVGFVQICLIDVSVDNLAVSRLHPTWILDAFKLLINTPTSWHTFRTDH